MLVAAILGAKARETVSGMVGRRWPCGWAAWAIDACHPWEPDHCAVVARAEKAARVALGYELAPPKPKQPALFQRDEIC
jgi:hypothetical protein